MQYYVLWIKNNTILMDYLEQYKVLLSQWLIQIKEKWILSEKIANLLEKEGFKEFVIDPDISSIVEYIYNEFIENKKQNIGDPKKYIDRLEKEIVAFLAGNIWELSMNMWEKINWTQIRLTNIDNNPFNFVEAHPDHAKDGATVWWWELSESKWLEVYNKTFRILESVDIWTYDELNMMIKKIIPLWTSKWVHNSCSYKECVGHLYLWYTTDASLPEINNLEAIIHESSHNKLNLIMHFDPIILNDYREIYYSPYRPDPRHIHWIYLWLHAFAPTIHIILGAFLSWVIKESFWAEKILLYHVKNKLALKVLEKYAKLTSLGQTILEEMKEVMKLTDERIKGLWLEQKLITNVHNNARSHFQNVIQKYWNVLR